MGGDVTNAFKNFFENGFVLTLVNQTNIALISKVCVPNTPIQFRSIVLCNFFYKISSKVLAYRLKGIMYGIISEKQGAFVWDRYIQDNILIAHEAFYHLKRKNSSKCFFFH